jgi:hypothetical protein
MWIGSLYELVPIAVMPGIAQKRFGGTAIA